LYCSLNLNNLFLEICATNIEKKTLKFFFDNISRSIGPEELRQFLAFEERQLVLDFYFFYLTKKTDKNSAQNILFLQKFSLPNFPLNSKDLIKIGLEGRALGEAFKLAKEFWAKENFLSDKSALITFLLERQSS